MSGTVKATLIAGVFSIAAAVIGQLPFFSQFLKSIGVRVADRVVHASYSPPPADLCSQNGDADRISIHTDGANNGTFWFCAQVVEGGRQVRSRWMSVSGTPR